MWFAHQPNHRYVGMNSMVICLVNKMNVMTTKLCVLHPQVTGGQTVLNPWPIIGGVAKSVVKDCDFIDPKKAEVGVCRGLFAREKGVPSDLRQISAFKINAFSGS